jgi:hypothetical protein
VHFALIMEIGGLQRHMGINGKKGKKTLSGKRGAVRACR